ncbi:MAG: 4-(cytidine 5'-diphospho)-2-C-methyl-D-erythritol kinase [Burkholderiaceae bacterium]|nr:4-(cytidine 5'-diphospho)-2-C-methyl-D-erythritol kinase [Burkholderiaceae bacterium]
MSNRLELLAPAKINLFLHVTGRRPNGYHELQSVFQLVDWCDRLCFSTIDRNTIIRHGGNPTIPPEKDLVVRAAQLLKSHTNYPYGVEIHLEKNIPIGAGLGGGSSDAATVLIALNQLWNLHLPKTELSELGLQLGADVPFFLFGHNAFVQGIGEQLECIDLPNQEFLIIFPGHSVSTQTVFQSDQLTRNHAPITMADFLASPWHKSRFNNDLQPVACTICPEVQRALDWLSQKLPDCVVRMSGSGSSVFAVIPPSKNPGDLEQIMRSIPSGWVSRLVRGLKRNPAYNSIKPV